MRGGRQHSVRGADGRRAAVAAAVCAVAAFASAAFAQGGQYVASTQDTFGSNPEAARRHGIEVLYHVADCIYRRDPGKALAMLRTQPGSPAAQTVLAGLTGRAQTCMPINKSLWANGSELRGALAASAYLDRNATAPETVGAYPLPSAWLETKRPDVARAVALHAFGACVVAKDVRGADALVRSPLASVGEGAALRRLSSSFSPCLNAGEGFRSDRATLRGLLSEELFRLSDGKPAVAVAAITEDRR